jgi:hypothetical protein
MTSSTKQQSKATNNKGSKGKSVIVAPVAKTTRVTMPQPQFKSLPNGNIRVKHSEYISEIFGSVDFNSNKFVVQPGFQQTFPWLALMAPLYESYVMKSLKFSFLTEKSTLTNGTLMMAVDYDPQDDAPLNKTSLMSYSGAVRSAPWSDCHYNCSTQAMNKITEKFIRIGSVANSDIKTFDIGNLFVATQGNADTSALGELHVSYEIELRTPQLDKSSFAALGSSFNQASGSSITGSRMLGTAPTLNISPSGLPLLYDTSSGVITIGSTGTFLLAYRVISVSSHRFRRLFCLRIGVHSWNCY